MTGAAVTVVRESPLEVDLHATVIDARGTGGGWAITLGAPSAADQSAPVLIATSATAACLTNSSCTPPSGGVQYPIAVSLTGARTPVFDAAPGSGLGAQTIDVRLTAPLAPTRSISLGLSLVGQP